MNNKPSVVMTVDRPSLLTGANFRHIYDFWLQAKGECELPPASAITPHAIPKGLLADCSIMSIEDGEKHFYIRLVGTRVVRALGVDLTGTWGEDQGNAPEVFAACVTCVQRRLPVYSDIATAWAGHDFKRSQTLMLPYAGTDSAVRRILTFIRFCFSGDPA
jgi:hypothetical protein